MKRLKFFFAALGILVLIFPAVSSSQVTYVIDASASYAYVYGTNPIPNTSWVSNINPLRPRDDGYFDLSLGGLGFVFQFYGVPVTNLRISTNGYMAFGTEEGQEFENSSIPYMLDGVGMPPNALIAPFWDDFDLTDSGQVRWGIFGTSPYRHLVIEWFQVPPFELGTQTYSFEAVLYESTNEIKFQYLNVVSGTASDYGAESTVGVENFDGTSGSQFSYNTPSLSNGLAIEFIPKLTTIFIDDFSTEKGWTYELGWERGPAVAGGGGNGNPDPGMDHSLSSDNRILGFAIGANYPNVLVEKSIISPPIDCTGQDRIFLKFWRYLNVESNSYDHAKVHVSNDRANWTQLWENPVFNIIDNQWTQVVFDISSIAANQGTVYIKFTMGPTNETGTYSGWNIDDLEVTSDYAGPLALYIPSGNSPNPNIDEIMIENGLGIKHDTAIPNDLISDYNLLILSEDGACNPTTAGYIYNFLQFGGGAIIMSGTPNLLAGNTGTPGDLSSIRDWFGAGIYGNDCGYGTVVVGNPLGTPLLINDKLDYTSTNTCGSASVYDLDPESAEISAWSGGRTHSFIHSFGLGNLFYYAGNPGYSGDSNPITVGNGLMLFEAGLFWVVTGCTMPSITIQPQSQTIQSGGTAILSVAATDATLLTYQWYEGASGDTSNPISGATSSSYTTPALTQTTSYWVRVNNSCGSYAGSNTAVIAMPGSCTAPNITSQPQSQTIQSGQTALMSVSASGTTPFSYQWYLGPSGDTSNPISGATSSNYTTPALTQTTSYWVRVNNSCGSYAHSNTAVIAMAGSCAAPNITSQPQSQTIQSGQTALMSVSASGTTPFSYQWYLGPSGDTSNPISGPTSSSYTTPVLTQTTSYWVRVNNSCGNASSNTVTITIAVAPVGPPFPPKNVSASDGTYLDRVEVTWAASTGATSYTVYRATSLSRWVTKIVLGTTSGTSYNDTTAIQRATYYYWVRASNAYGTSNFSAYDAGYRSDGTPPPPTGVSASDGIYTDRVEVSWTAPSGAKSYTVYRATSLRRRRATKTVLGTTSETFFNDTTAVPKTTYYYYVKASNTYGTSIFSSYDAGYRSDGTPPAPTNVSASDGTYTDRVEVTWATSTGADSYTVYRATSLTRWATKTVLGTTSETFFNDTTATPGRIYYYWVRATNSYGTSNFSAYDAGHR